MGDDAKKKKETDKIPEKCILLREELVSYIENKQRKKIAGTELGDKKLQKQRKYKLVYHIA